MIKQYKFAICDDDIQFCNKIKSYIIEYYGENKVEISIFNSGEDFIKSKVKYDCIFLDIEMINLNGIEIATMIRNYDLDTYIIHFLEVLIMLMIKQLFCKMIYYK